MKISSLKWVALLLLCLPSTAPAATVVDPTIKIMALGDSITEGMSQNGYYTFRDGLYDLLSKKNYDFDFVGSRASGTFLDNQHEGVSGNKTSDWYYKDSNNNVVVDNITQAITTYAPDVVLIHIGTNDLLARGDNLIPEKVKERTYQIVDKILELNSETKVILAKIISYNGPDKASESYDQENRNRIDYYNYQLQWVYDNYYYKSPRLKLADMYTALTIDYMGEAGGTHFMDTTHPNQAGSDIMAKRWFDALNDPTFITFSQKTPTPAPLPALLLGSGLAGLAFLRRRRSR
jgi:lysophospholipase L1-like esterase